MCSLGQRGFAGDYWSLVRCGHEGIEEDKQWPPNMPFCCGNCMRSAGEEFLSKVRCCTEPELEAAPGTPVRTRTGSVIAPGPADWSHPDNCETPAAWLYKNALQRNATISRRLRARWGNMIETRDAGLKHYPMGTWLLEEYWTSLIDALNIDTVILYAASVLESMPSSQRPYKVLPRHPRWREDLHFYRRVICSVRKIYHAHVKNKRRGVQFLFTNPSTRPSWVERIRDGVMDLF